MTRPFIDSADRIARHALTVALAVTTGLPAVAVASPYDTTLVSRGQSGSANGESTQPDVSADGAAVVFRSTATNLTNAPLPVVGQIYRRNTRLNTVALISGGRSPRFPWGVWGANGTASDPTISDDGRYVAFTSTASNLVVDDDNDAADVFVHDTVTHNTRLVSRATGSDGALADADSGLPRISADGRCVVYQSLASNLGAWETWDLDGGPDLDVFVRNLDTNETIWVNRKSGPDGATTDISGRQPSIDGACTHVVFRAAATDVSNESYASVNLTTDKIYAAGDHAYLRQLSGQQKTTLVSRLSGKGAPVTISDGPVLSDNGDHVAFTTTEQAVANLDTDPYPDAYVRDLASGQIALASSDNDGLPLSNTAAAIAPDGQHVLLHMTGPNFGLLLLRDLADQASALLSRASGSQGAPANDYTLEPQTGTGMAANGSAVAFASVATNLDPADGSPDSSVYLRELP